MTQTMTKTITKILQITDKVYSRNLSLIFGYKKKTFTIIVHHRIDLYIVSDKQNRYMSMHSLSDSFRCIDDVITYIKDNDEAITSKYKSFELPDATDEWMDGKTLCS